MRIQTSRAVREQVSIFRHHEDACDSLSSTATRRKKANSPAGEYPPPVGVLYTSRTGHGDERDCRCAQVSRILTETHHFITLTNAGRHVAATTASEADLELAKPTCLGNGSQVSCRIYNRLGWPTIPALTRCLSETGRSSGSGRASRVDARRRRSSAVHRAADHLTKHGQKYVVSLSHDVMQLVGVTTYICMNDRWSQQRVQRRGQLPAVGRDPLRSAPGFHGFPQFIAPESCQQGCNVTSAPASVCQMV